MTPRVIVILKQVSSVARQHKTLAQKLAMSMAFDQAKKDEVILKENVSETILLRNMTSRAESKGNSSYSQRN